MKPLIRHRPTERDNEFIIPIADFETIFYNSYYTAPSPTIIFAQLKQVHAELLDVVRAKFDVSPHAQSLRDFIFNRTYEYRLTGRTLISITKESDGSGYRYQFKEK